MKTKQRHPGKRESAPILHIILLGPMDFPLEVLEKSLERPGVQVLAVDGGLRHLRALKKRAPLLAQKALSIGDGDSSKKPLAIAKKNDLESDLAFALRYAEKHFKAARSFFLAGFLGGRADHQLFVWGEVAHFIQRRSTHKAPCFLNLEHAVHFFPPGAHRLDVKGLFSLVSFVDNHIKITGRCQYPAPRGIDLPPLSSRGLSNCGQGAITVSAQESFALFLGEQTELKTDVF